MEFSSVMRFVGGLWQLRAKYCANGLPMTIYEPQARAKEQELLAPAIEKINSLVPPQEARAHRIQGPDHHAQNARLSSRGARRIER